VAIVVGVFTDEVMWIQMKDGTMRASKMFLTCLISPPLQKGWLDADGSIRDDTRFSVVHKAVKEPFDRDFIEFDFHSFLFLITIRM